MDTKALRQKILNLAIRGKLVPQDPNDEPASVLLERIRAQKQQMVREGKLKAKDIKNDTVIFVGEDNLHYEKIANGTVKCIEDEIPFEVPEGWEWARVFSISDNLPYGTAKKSEKEGQIAVLRMGNIQAGEIDYRDLVFSSDEEDMEQYLLSPGDLLFNRTNSAEWVGKTAIYRGDIPCIYAGYLIRIRTLISAEYLNAVMNSGYAKEYCALVKTDGVNQSNINAQKLGAFLVPVPSLMEQERIASWISAALPYIQMIQQSQTEISDLVTTAKTHILDLAIRGQLIPQNPDDEPAAVLLERIRAEKEALIKQGKIKRNKRESVIFRGEDNSYYEKLGEDVRCIDGEIPFDIPESWAFVRLKHIGEIVGGGTPKTNNPAFWDGSIAWITPADLSGYEAIRISSGSRNITEEGLRGSSAQLMPAGSVLYTSRAPIGYVAIASNPISTNQGFKSVVPYEMEMNKYLYFCLKARTDDITQRATGTTFKEISGSQMAETIISVPPLAEQERIVAQIQRLTTQLFVIESALE